MANDKGTIANAVESFVLPQKDIRPRCLSLFVESIIEANELCSSKASDRRSSMWAVHYVEKEMKLRLLLGGLIVFTIAKGRIWLSLDRERLNADAEARQRLNEATEWEWDSKSYPKYERPPSRNGYYTPDQDRSEISDDAIWRVIRALHFEFIKNIAERGHSLRQKSQDNHSPALLDYLREISGKRVPDPSYARSSVQQDDISSQYPDEIDDQRFIEGMKKQVTVNAYERNPSARKRCLQNHGTSCYVCKLDLGKKYGEAGDGLIHVHHLKPLSEIGESYEVDPVKDLRPVCPNCHAIIHRKTPPYSPEEVKEFISQAKNSDDSADS